MLTIGVVERTGVERRLQTEPGRTVMETICDADVDELLALLLLRDMPRPRRPRLCGHCTDKLRRNELLASSSDRDGTSRLSCQLSMTPAMDGLRVTVAADD